MRRLVIVGIGEDGWTGLSSRARDALCGAKHVLGAPRQLALLPARVVDARREPWPMPMMPRVQAIAKAVAGGAAEVERTVVLASGDPMLHGIGATFARLVDPTLLEVLPSPSAYSLACARLGWAQHEVPLVSLVADPERDPLPALAGGRAIVYVAGAAGARRLAALLRAEGLGAAQLTILARLGGRAESIVQTTAEAFDEDADPLHLVAIDVRDQPAWRDGAFDDDTGGQDERDVVDGAQVPRLMSRVPGLPDGLFGGDGQLTRADVRAVALAGLAPAPGELLWDVGAGSGTIGIEWCRAARGARAIAIERREDRCQTISANARALDAPGVEVVVGAVPDALAGLPAPHAVFVGGATSQPGLIERCWASLRPGGRLVAAAVTLESERALIDAHARLGGALLRLQHDQAEALGGFTAWRPARPVVHWSITKEARA